MADDKSKEEFERFKSMSKHRQEEEYFYKRDRELLRALREKCDTERTRMERENQRELHWMRCPKCGGQMEEVPLDVLRVDRCQDCHGVYFDDGELEILLHLEGVGEGDFMTKLLASLKPQKHF